MISGSTCLIIIRHYVFVFFADPGYLRSVRSIDVRERVDGEGRAGVRRFREAPLKYVRNLADSWENYSGVERGRN